MTLPARSSERGRFNRRRRANPTDPPVANSRRSGRASVRRRGRFGILLLVACVLLVAAAPSIALRTPIARTVIQRQFGAQGFQITFSQLRFGWLTPLHASGVELVGVEAGTRLEVERLDCDRSLLRLLVDRGEPIRASARGVRLSLKIQAEGSSLETDLATLLGAASADTGAPSLPAIELDVQSLGILAFDAIREEIWAIDQGRGAVRWSPAELTAEGSGILSDPHAGSGSFEAAVRLASQAGSESVYEVKLQGLPLRVASLAGRWLPDHAETVPAELSGDASGSLRLVGSATGVWSVDANQFEIRNLVASGPGLGDRVWRNELAVVEGAADWRDSGVIGRGFRLATDFAEVQLDGTFLIPDGLLTSAGPLTWLSKLDGRAVASIDLPLLDQRLPGFLPLREDIQLLAGRIVTEVLSQTAPSQPDAGTARLVTAAVQSEPIRAQSQGRAWTIEPASLTTKLWVDPATGDWRAEQCALTSVFGTANLDGEWRHGRANAEFDLGRLAAMLEPLIDLPDLQLGGVATGEVAWSAQADDRWSLHGDAEATELTVLLPGGLQLHRPTLSVHADVVAQVAGFTWTELTAAELNVRSTSLEADAVLVRAIPAPHGESSLPLRITGRGRLEVLNEFLGPWLPDSLRDLRGGFAGRLDTSVGLAGGEIVSASVQLEDPRGTWGNQTFAQRQLGIEFDGRYAWPTGELLAKSLTLTGEAVSAVAKGKFQPDAVELEFAWRASLERLQASVQPVIATQPPAVSGADRRLVSNPRPANSQAVVASADWAVHGHCEGNGWIRSAPDGPRILLSGRTVANQFEYLQLDPSNPRRSPELLWAEPSLAIDTELTYDRESQSLHADRLKLQTDWFQTQLAGGIPLGSAPWDIRLTGPARIDTERLAPRLSALCGLPIGLAGIHETPIDLALSWEDDGSMPMLLVASLGWEAGQIAGLALGPCSAPITMTDKTVTIDPTTIPVDPGEIRVAADLHYAESPMWLEVKPGSGAKNLRLTRQLSDRWLQYLAPLLARATTVEGSFGVDLSEARVNLDDPNRSRVRGQLQIQQIRFEAGPVAEQLVSSLQQIRQLSRGRPFDPQSADAERSPGRNLVTLPAQSVDFDFSEGVISHQRMFLDIEPVRLVTSGQVHVDGRLNLVTQTPLDAAWLGNDLKGLAGATVTLPITGTLSQPRLDPSGIRNLATQLGVQAIQNSAENYLEKQLNRGLERLLGR